MDKNFSRVPSDIFPPGVCELIVTYKKKKEKREPIVSSIDASNFAHTHLYSEGMIEYAEYFYILLLDRVNRLFAYKQISQGGLAGTVVDPKLIFQTALLCHASSIIMIHNHPSGSLKPSEHDIQLTKKIAEAGKVLEIAVLDHLIVSTEGYYSFADEGFI